MIHILSLERTNMSRSKQTLHIKLFQNYNMMNCITTFGKDSTIIDALEFSLKEEVMIDSNYYPLKQVSVLWLWERWKNMVVKLRLFLQDLITTTHKILEAKLYYSLEQDLKFHNRWLNCIK